MQLFRWTRSRPSLIAGIEDRVDSCIRPVFVFGRWGSRAEMTWREYKWIRQKWCGIKERLPYSTDYPLFFPYSFLFWTQSRRATLYIANMYQQQIARSASITIRRRQVSWYPAEPLTTPNRQNFCIYRNSRCKCIGCCKSATFCDNSRRLLTLKPGMEGFWTSV